MLLLQWGDNMPKTLTMLSAVFALVIMTAHPSGATPMRVQLNDATGANAAPAQKAHYGWDDDGYRPYHEYYRPHYYSHSYKRYHYYAPYWYYRGGDWCRAWLHECARRWGWGGWHYRRCLGRHDC